MLGLPPVSLVLGDTLPTFKCIRLSGVTGAGGAPGARLHAHPGVSSIRACGYTCKRGTQNPLQNNGLPRAAASHARLYAGHLGSAVHPSGEHVVGATQPTFKTIMK